MLDLCCVAGHENVTQNDLAWKPHAEPGFAISGDVLILLLGLKGGAAAGEMLLLSRMEEELVASPRCMALVSRTA